MGRLVGLALVAVCALGGEASAKITNFTWSPAVPRLGSILTYTPVDDGQSPPPAAITSYQWSYQYDDTIIGGQSQWQCITAWTNDPASPTPTKTWMEDMPGPFRVRLTVKYAPIGFPPVPQPDVVITKTIVIPPADGFRISKGINPPVHSNVQMGGDIEINFTIQCIGQDCGPIFVGQAQELITDKTISWPTVQNPPDDANWTPPLGAPSPVFHRTGNYIVDIKGVHLNDVPGWNWWNTMPVGTVFYTRTQHLRLAYADPCNNIRYMPLGTVTIRSRKSGTDTWTMEVVQ